MPKKQKLTLGYGLHNQAQPFAILLAESRDANGNRVQTNKELKFMRSQHFVMGYDYAFAKNWRAKIELYHQEIDNVPVDPMVSSFSLLNLGADFGFQAGKINLQNEGTGFNQGVELTNKKIL